MKWLFPQSNANSYGAGERRSAGAATDLVLLVGFVLLAVAVLLAWNPNSPPVRALVGGPLLFLAPGYAVVSLLFPRSKAAAVRNAGQGGSTTNAVSTVGSQAGRSLHERSVSGVTEVERAALAFGTSLALLPILGLMIATVDGFTPATVIVTVSTFVLVVALFALVRRYRVPPRDRYRLEAGARLSAIRSFLFPRGSPALALVNLALTVSVLLALGTGGYALLAPQDGETYTGMQLLSEDDSGDLVAAGYPDSIEPGESVPLTVAVENQEGTAMEYTVVVQQQQYADGSIVDRTELDRVQYELADGATGYGDREVTPTAEDGQIRLVFLLYPDGAVPSEPTTDNAYRYTHLWVAIE